MYHVDVPFEGVGVGKALVAFLADVGTEFEMDHVDVSLQAIEISSTLKLSLWNPNNRYFRVQFSRLDLEYCVKF